MIDTFRTLSGDAAAYPFRFEELGVELVRYQWHDTVSEALAHKIVELMRETTKSAPIIGFGEQISDAEAIQYIEDLRANLAARKCTLLAIFANQDRLIGLCTLRRNLNPNNRHIADLAKGMISEAFRGRTVLPAAFYEIALHCEQTGVGLLTLDVRSGSPAHRTWERFGFETWGTLPDYARVDGTAVAGHFMMQKVSDLKARAIAALQVHAKGAAAPQHV